ncbi:MAG: hypothetical protein DBX47_06470 [Clostridiales bacterium]|nr:MAG: hypothetical protein DBX47_06470 [Clostridiales bacterium]
MKKQKFILIITVIICVVIITTIIVVNIPYFRVRLYTADRITGTFSMNIEGVDYKPLKESFEFDGACIKKTNDNNGYFSLKGGKYGAYNIGFYIENNILAGITKDESFNSLTDSTLLLFTYINSNWWNITEINLNADLVQENNQWILKIKVDYREQQEDGSAPLRHTYETTFNYIETAKKEEINVYFGL